MDKYLNSNFTSTLVKIKYVTREGKRGGGEGRER